MNEARLRNVRTEISLQVLAYNMKRTMQILGVPALLEAIRTRKTFAGRGSVAHNRVEHRNWLRKLGAFPHDLDPEPTLATPARPLRHLLGYSVKT
jgi:hypothetical protein